MANKLRAHILLEIRSGEKWKVESRRVRRAHQILPVCSESGRLATERHGKHGQGYKGLYL